jgi:CPA2 family monovalent cation:H+ antiporter-2
VPSIIGFLITGVLAGPHGLRLVRALEEVEILAEIGVMLLLFTIGLEFSLKRLMQIKRAVLLGGALQVFITLVAFFAVFYYGGFTAGEAIFIGCLVALSSTAIVLKLIQERGEVDTQHGRTTLAILIFQDIIVVPMMLLVPMMSGSGDGFGKEIIFLLLKGVVIIFLVVVSGRWIVPRLLLEITRMRIRELFLASIFAICLGVVWLTSSVGLSLALGAFLAGLIISESEYANQALGNILPFRDIFTSFFFVSIGMLLDMGFFVNNLGLILPIAAGILVCKTIVAGGATLILGFPFRTAVLVGLGLNQVGEFSFILSKIGVAQGLLGGGNYQVFLAVSILTMAVTPLIVAAAPVLADRAIWLPLPRKLRDGLARDQWVPATGKTDHVVIVGFGVSGRHLAHAAQAAGIDYIAIDMNPETVRDEQRKGEPILYGDATQEAVLEHAGILRARIIAVAVNDPTATRRITEISRRVNPGLHAIVRTRYLKEVESLYRLGADEVIPEEYETSIEIFIRVLIKYLVPREDIERFVAGIRSSNYAMFRSLSRERPSISDLKEHMPDIEISSLRLLDGSPLVSKSLAQADLRKKYGVTVLAMRRDGDVMPNPDAGMILQQSDILIVMGNPEDIARVAHACEKCEEVLSSSNDRTGVVRKNYGNDIVAEDTSM